MILGVDAGNARVKVVSLNGVQDFDAALGEWRERRLVSTHGPDDMEVKYRGQKYFAGSLARCESEYGGTMMGDSKAHEEARIRVLLACARANANDCYIITGQPISQHTPGEKGRIISMLLGQHQITVNNHSYHINISGVRVAAEGAAAFWSAPQPGLVRIIDAGSGTINCATVLDHRYVDRDSLTLPFGLHTGKSSDRSAMADGIVRQLLKKWNRNDQVFLVGGGAESIAPHLQHHFPNAKILRPIAANQQLHPIYANAVGYYQLAGGLFSD